LGVKAVLIKLVNSVGPTRPGIVSKQIKGVIIAGYHSGPESLIGATWIQERRIWQVEGKRGILKAVPTCVHGSFHVGVAIRGIIVYAPKAKDGIIPTNIVPTLIPRRLYNSG